MKIQLLAVTALVGVVTFVGKVNTPITYANTCVTGNNSVVPTSDGIVPEFILKEEFYTVPEKIDERFELQENWTLLGLSSDGERRLFVDSLDGLWLVYSDESAYKLVDERGNQIMAGLR